MRICAIIPAYNEAPYVGAVVEGAAAYVDHVVVIDDGSTDGTAEVARAAGAACIGLSSNRGKAYALRSGLEYARKQGFTHALTLDGDGQHAPEDIPALLEMARRSGADLVIGARAFDRGKMPAARYFSNTVGSRIASWLAGCEVRDSQSGFRLLRLEKFDGLVLRSSAYEIEMEVLIKLARRGCSVAHAPVRAIYAGGLARSKMRPVRDTVRICFWSLAYRFLGV